VIVMTEPTDRDGETGDRHHRNAHLHDNIRALPTIPCCNACVDSFELYTSAARASSDRSGAALPRQAERHGATRGTGRMTTNDSWNTSGLSTTNGGVPAELSGCVRSMALGAAGI
jgi:hypothetical protein